jgi:hypothetical protein
MPCKPSKLKRLYVSIPSLNYTITIKKTILKPTLTSANTRSCKEADAGRTIFFLFVTEKKIREERKRKTNTPFIILTV